MLARARIIYKTTGKATDDLQCSRPHIDDLLKTRSGKKVDTLEAAYPPHQSYPLTKYHKSLLILLLSFNTTFNGRKTADKQILWAASGQDLSSLSRCL